MVKLTFLSCLFLVLGSVFCASSPVTERGETETVTESKSAFGPAFDEIVVESHLTVRRRNNNERQSRNQNANQTIRTKREIYNKHKKLKPFKKIEGSASSSQAQAFNSVGTLGNFGASATGAMTQNFGIGPHGLLSSAGFSGTQQYVFNGQTVDVAFSGGKSGGAVVTVSGANTSKKRKL